MNVLVVVGHKDDEVQGAAGAIAWHVANGDDVLAVCLTDGIGSRYTKAGTVPYWSQKFKHPQWQQEAIEREAAAEAAADSLGFTWLCHGDLPDNELDVYGIKNTAQWLAEQVVNLEPDIIYTNYYADLNVDHRICYQAVRIVFRPIRGRKCCEIRCMEVPRATEWCDPAHPFNPNVYVELTRELTEKKEKALAAYYMELTAYPDLASNKALDSLGRRRGCEAGVKFAEGFVSVRRLIT